MIKEACRMLQTLPDRIADALNRWVQSQHRPVDVMGDQSVAWCTTCREEWPCRGQVRLDKAHP